jgi:hypothetical protein
MDLLEQLKKLADIQLGNVELSESRNGGRALRRCVGPK